MKRTVFSLLSCAAFLGVLGCEPRAPDEPPLETSPPTSEDDRPPATTRAASQPPAVPVEELTDTVPAARTP